VHAVRCSAEGERVIAALQLLTASDPAPVETVNPEAAAPFFLTCEHAGNLLPLALGSLGLSEVDRRRHIAWDIGAEGVARRLASELDAALVLQRYSRLVVDCNRSLANPTLIAEVSEHTEIPGNQAISGDERAARIAEIYRPFHDRVTQLLDARDRTGRETVLVAVHSFTPVFKGISRPWQVGVMFHRQPAFARAVIARIEREKDVALGINEPYALTPGTDFTALYHGEERGILHTEIEIRQDLIGTPADQENWAGRIAGWLSDALTVVARR
jgi:predicted N-formylglutamate amidohydrolase